MKFQRIKDLREDKDLKQEDVAKYLKIHKNTYNNYENGKRDIPAYLIIELCKLYNVTADYILDIENKQKLEKIEIIGRGLRIL